ncbi:MAG: SDR family oxidoreductase [Paracoccaceae bacterium]
MKSLLIFGFGYCAKALAKDLLAQGWKIEATTRNADKAEAMRAMGVVPHIWPGTDMRAALAAASHVLVSAGPDAAGDPVLNALSDAFANATHLRWLGYLSTTGVYGDAAGGWVDEDTPRLATSTRGQLRVDAEDRWLALHQSCGLAVHIFRLAGIYGPGRGPFAKLRAGTARRIIKPNQVFSRIHVDDIAQILAASIAQPNPGRAYNVCDDEPAPPQDVIAAAARLLGLNPPPEESFETAQMGAMAKSFYGESKRVSNARIKAELGVELLHPTYMAGLRAVLAAEGNSSPVTPHSDSSSR